MMNKNDSTLMSSNLRMMRIREHPIQCEENLLIADQLERGFLRIYEYTGGSIYIPMDAAEVDNCDNIALVAELTVTIRPEKKVVKPDRIFSEFGYALENVMRDQLIHFVNFYGYSFGLLDLRKRKQNCA